MLDYSISKKSGGKPPLFNDLDPLFYLSSFYLRKARCVKSSGLIPLLAVIIP
jgi:hypothetical protein